MTSRNEIDGALEEGDIFFLYSPDVNEDEPDRLGDVQRFYMALRPRGGKHVRLMVVGRKRLPDVTEHEREWGFVDAVERSESNLEKTLREKHYGTQTRGEQEQPAARPAGEGVYAVTLEDGQLHLSYALELPEEPGEVQKAFNIAQEASFALSVKNPEKGSPKSAGLDEGGKADYPESLQDEFRDRRFAREDVRLLDYEGAEFVLVGARTNPQRAYDIELETEDETGSTPDVMSKLRMAKSRHPIEPLFAGRWS
ncbi:hypothetical protein [Pelagibacterium xiamenense]|uniref:hypothetical protein n=1 Tax=Pelagibacterium xiamenense TaxID=2901140 RepID=UPI001E2A3404|nr:hypothetical protein [Pelagibacterium xiamenense]MCD7058665.1 hypothetical protein [Pelagibacterium xiamenense]